MAFSFTWKALLVIFLLAEVDSTGDSTFQDHLTSHKGKLDKVNMVKFFIAFSKTVCSYCLW